LTREGGRNSIKKGEKVETCGDNVIITAEGKTSLTAPWSEEACDHNREGLFSKASGMERGRVKKSVKEASQFDRER